MPLAGGTATGDATIYLIRHAEPQLPDDNKRFVGRSDPPLSARGLEQARRLGEQLRPVRFDAVYSSDLQRSWMTAEIIIHGSPRLPRLSEQVDLHRRADLPQHAEKQRSASAPLVQQQRALREIDAGSWEWLTFEETQRLYPDEYAEHERDPAGYPFPGGESFHDVRARVVPAFQRIIERGGDTNILVVGHLGVNRVLLCEFLGLPLGELFSIKQSYGHVNVLVASRRPAGGMHIAVAGS